MREAWRIVAVAVLSGCGCGGDGRGPVTPGDPVAAGWESFAAGAYGEARDLFQLAVDGGDDGAEARSGLGWSFARLGQLDAALAQFDAALGFAAAGAEALAGRAAAARDLRPPQFQQAIASADSALAVAPAFAFGHDASVDWRDLRLVIAQSAFGLGDYTRALAEVDSLPEGNPPDPGSPGLRAELFEELERLGNLQHSRTRPGDSAPAGGDPLPPVLVVRALQNPALPAELHVCLLADEPLDPASIHIEDHSIVIGMEPMSEDGLLFRGSYRVTFEGVHHFETMACDLGGNCTEETFAAPIHLAPPG